MIFFPFYYPVQVYSVLCIHKMDNPILKRTHFFSDGYRDRVIFCHHAIKISTIKKEYGKGGSKSNNKNKMNWNK